MVKKCALRRRDEVSLAVEGQLLWGCTVLEVTLALRCVLRGTVQLCGSSSKHALAPVIGTEAATAPKSAVQRQLCISSGSAGKGDVGFLQQLAKSQWSVGSSSGLEVSTSKAQIRDRQ